MFDSVLDSEQVFGSILPMSSNACSPPPATLTLAALAFVAGAWAGPAGARGRGERPAGPAISRTYVVRSGRHAVVDRPTRRRPAADPRPIVDAFDRHERRRSGGARAGSDARDPGRRVARIRTLEPFAHGRLTSATSRAYRPPDHHILWWSSACGVPGAATRTTRSSTRGRRNGGAAIRRRRECLYCERRLTTFERVEELGLLVVKRDGSKEPFDRAKVDRRRRKAIKNRPVTESRSQRLADRVEEHLRRKGPVVTTQQVGLEVLAQLRSSTTWPTCGSRASTRTSRRSPTSSASSASCSRRRSPAKRRSALTRRRTVASSYNM